MAKGKTGSVSKKMGRPPVVIQSPEWRLAARKYAEEALNTIVEIMRDTMARDSDRLNAAQQVLDRAYGKPIQAVSADVTATVDHRVKNDAERFTSTIAGLIARSREASLSGEDAGGGQSSSGVPLEILGETGPTSP